MTTTRRIIQPAVTNDAGSMTNTVAKHISQAALRSQESPAWQVTRRMVAGRSSGRSNRAGGATSSRPAQLTNLLVSLSSNGSVATLTWTPVTGLVTIQKLVNGTWAALTVIDGQTGQFIDSDTEFPNPVSYQVRLGAGAWQQRPVSPGEFTIFQLPDVHSRNQATSTQTFDWLLHSFSSMNGKLVVFCGDLISTPSNTSQWDYIIGQLDRLNEADIPLFLAPGNHDWLDSNKSWWNDRVLPKYWHLGNATLMQNWETMTEDDTFNTAMRWSLGQLKLVFIGLAANVGGSWTAQHEWALSVARKYSDHLAIFVTHAYLDNDGTLQDPQTSNYLYGDKIWDEAVSLAPNAIQVMCGHTHTASYGWWHLAQVGYANRQVMALNIDTQDFPNGGDDYVRTYTWKPDINAIVAKMWQVTSATAATEVTQAAPITPGNEAAFTFAIR